MSASIHYRRNSKAADPTLANVLAPSGFITSMEAAFGRFPCELGGSDLPVLRGMAAVHGGPDDANPYLELGEIIEKFGSVELYATY